MEEKKQVFHCKKCDKDFEIYHKDKYWNYNCPDCNTICKMKDYIGPAFRNCPTLKY